MGPLVESLGARGNKAERVIVCCRTVKLMCIFVLDISKFSPQMLQRSA